MKISKRMVQLLSKKSSIKEVAKKLKISNKKVNDKLKILIQNGLIQSTKKDCRELQAFLKEMSKGKTVKFEPKFGLSKKGKNLLKSDAEKIKILHKALTAAKGHLEYCGYGDKWERECAKESKLEEQIKEALEIII